MTADESAQNFVARELHDAAVQGMGLVTRAWVVLSSIVEVWNAVVLFGHAFKLAITPHHAKVPKAEDLVLPI